MKKTGIFYGSTTGTTADVAADIAHGLGLNLADVHDVAKTAPSAVGDYELLIFGTSTWGSGDLQDDMADFLDGVRALDLAGKDIALFGCGDTGMADTFCDGVGEMYEQLKGTEARMVGAFPADCYDFSESRAVVDGKAVGLLLDNTNHENLSPERIKQWCELLRKD